MSNGSQDIGTRQSVEGRRAGRNQGDTKEHGVGRGFLEQRNHLSYRSAVVKRHHGQGDL